MGMFNEVHKKCPDCGHKATMQIQQITLGFGNFDLDNPSSMDELSVEELYLLYEYVVEEYQLFECENCNTSFKFYKQYQTIPKNERELALKELFGIFPSV